MFQGYGRLLGAIRRFGLSQDPLRVWDQVTTFQELVVVNTAFILGLVDMTPYHAGPLDPETLPLVPKIALLNTLGFVSINSQPGLFERGAYVPETWYTRNGREQGAWYVDTDQRGFIYGFLHSADLPRLLTFLQAQQDIYAVVAHALGGAPIYSSLPVP